MSKKIKLSNKEWIILKLLYDKTDAITWMNGLDMVLQSKGKVKHGVVYVYLRRLENKGYIISDATPTDPLIGLDRRQYAIVKRGNMFVDLIKYQEKLSDNS